MRDIHNIDYNTNTISFFSLIGTVECRMNTWFFVGIVANICVNCGRFLREVWPKSDTIVAGIRVFRGGFLSMTKGQAVSVICVNCGKNLSLSKKTEDIIRRDAVLVFSGRNQSNCGRN